VALCIFVPLVGLVHMHFLIECAIEQLNQDFVWVQLVRWNTGNRPVTIDYSPLVGRPRCAVYGSLVERFAMAGVSEQVCRTDFASGRPSRTGSFH
jgi:hypothetical protein